MSAFGVRFFFIGPGCWWRVSGDGQAWSVIGLVGEGG